MIFDWTNGNMYIAFGLAIVWEGGDAAEAGAHGQGGKGWWMRW